MPLFWISLAFLCGILLSPSFAFPILGWSLIALSACLLFLPPIFRRLSIHFYSRFTGLTKALKLGTPAIYPRMIVLLCLGAIRYQLTQPTIDPAFSSYYNDQSTKFIIDGVITEPPDIRDTYINLRLRIKQLQPVGANQFIQVRGLLLARVSTNTAFNYGYLIRLQGHLETPIENEDFSYRDYLAVPCENM